jgi:Cys-tRNA(Pro)/Cys-tRNA(Cys) deacylase
MKQKTNSMRFLESQRVTYRTHEFSPEIRSAADLAAALGVPAAQVFKTLVVLRERGRALLVMIPGDRSLNLKALAKVVGEKKLSMATHREAETLTGLEVGGISALALMHKGFQVYADKGILGFPEAYVSAGTRGVNLGLRPQDLIRVTRARVVEVAEPQRDEVVT